MTTLTEYELRQILLIINKIHSFEKEKTNLFELICDLSGILNALEFKIKPYTDDFRKEINLLELIHDSIEDGSIFRWIGNYKEDMLNSISKLKAMTATILDEYLGLSDSNISESAILLESNWLMCQRCNDAWESDSLKAMVICPKCDRALHNPRWLNMKRKKLGSNKI
ncbi:MAG: hypothetical protein JSS32_08455 [Verrucomicrobia bacterium]|nr:hypothetical protein [Verrucomicrobiota bacterium]